MEQEIKALPKKYFQITDEKRRDRMVAYVRLDHVLDILEDINKVISKGVKNWKWEEKKCEHCGFVDIPKVGTR